MVINGSGLVVVVMGYRIVVCCLLDWLENVFNRDLFLYGCNCVMCERFDEVNRGFGWGEVFECVSGWVELLLWLFFDFLMFVGKVVEELVDVFFCLLLLVKMDFDIVEEFREYYLC